MAILHYYPAKQIPRVAGIAIACLLAASLLLVSVAGLAIYRRANHRSNRDIAVSQLCSLMLALDGFTASNGRFPTSAEGFEILFNSPSDVGVSFAAPCHCRTHGATRIRRRRRHAINST